MAARKRDTEALGIAAQIVDTIAASPEARQTGILAGARAYRRGEAAGAARVAGLEQEIEALRQALRRSELRAGWTPAEVSYVHTLKSYGMKLPDIADTMGVTVDDVKEALRLYRDKRVRKAGDRGNLVPGVRAIDTA